VEPAATIIGAPYDATASFRRGARYAPAAIRWTSQSIESYSSMLDGDLREAVLLDHGDLQVESLAPEAMVTAVAGAIGVLPGLPVLLGGVHTVSVGAVRALAARHPDLHLVVLDAHLDLREEYDGSPWSHACTTRRLADALDPTRIALFGVRSGAREEFAAAGGLLATERSLRVSRSLWARLEGRPIYLSIDIDVLDPAVAPGTGNPEPAGPGAAELLDFLRVLAPLRVVGIDVVEVAPPYDPSGRTVILAAAIVREAVLTWAAKRPA